MSATLLLADDSVTIQRVIELTFAGEDVRVVTVNDGQEAIARIDADCPDIVLADVGMPKVDGYEVASHVKRSPLTKHVPVLLLTGAFEPIDEARARATGCDGVLVKPFEPQMLVARVKDLLAGQRPAEPWPATPVREAARLQPLPTALLRPAAPAAPAAPTVTVAAPATPTLRAPVPPPVMPRPEPRRTEMPTFEAVGEPGPLPPPSAVEAVFEHGLDDLDLAFSRLDPVAAPSRIDPHTASDFRKDIDHVRREPPNAAATVAPPADYRDAMDRDWDVVPGPPEVPLSEAPPTPAAPPPWSPAPAPAAAAVPAPPAVEAPPEWAAPPGPPPRPVPPPTLATAFSALLAAEQAYPAYRAPTAPAALSETAIEEVVRQVLIRMTDDVVRKVVLDAADRLIREEIDRIKK